MNLFGRSKKTDNEQMQLIEAIGDLDLRYVTVSLVDAKGDEEDLGQTQLLLSDGKIYHDGESLFLTTPDKLKTQAVNQEATKAPSPENFTSADSENGAPPPRRAPPSRS